MKKLFFIAFSALAVSAFLGYRYKNPDPEPLTPGCYISCFNADVREQFRQEAFDKLSAYLGTDNHLDLSLFEAYVFFAEEISADPELFSSIVAAFALELARRTDRDMESIDGDPAAGGVSEGIG